MGIPGPIMFRITIFFLFICIIVIVILFLIEYFIAGRLKGKVALAEASHLKGKVKGNLDAAKVYKKTAEEIKRMRENANKKK